ncbi:MAG: hypothetical protein SVO26_00995 [Chloroflexota bacterium]|nr:hypothetical protein [Chloroflexota bacterium]
MKRLTVPIIAILFLVAITAASCDGDATIPPTGEELVSSCIDCHSDIEVLAIMAEPQQEQEEPEEASGEG